MTVTAGVDRMSRSRVLPTRPAAVFAVLSDPTLHHATEPTDWVRDAIDADRITDVGQVFGMNMQREQIGLPPFPPDFLDRSLAALEAAVGT